MTLQIPHPVLDGRKALVVGIANEHSIAYGCAKAFRELGAELAVTYLNEKAQPHVRAARARTRRDAVPAARRRRSPGELEAVFEAHRTRAGAGSTSSCTRSRGRRRTTCRAACSTARPKASRSAMDVSCHSFIRMARLAAPLMTDGGTMFAMSYYGAQPRRAELQRDGAGEGGARGRRAATSPTSSARSASACIRSRPGR